MREPTSKEASLKLESTALNKLTVRRSHSGLNFEGVLLQQFDAISTKYSHSSSHVQDSQPDLSTSLSNLGSLDPLNESIHRTISCYAKVLKDYIPRKTDEIGLEEEDIVNVHQIFEKEGRIFGENNGVWGYFPSSHVKILTEEEAITEGVQISSSQALSCSLNNVHNEEEDTSTRPWFNKYKKGTKYEKKPSQIKHEIDLQTNPNGVAVSLSTSSSQSAGSPLLMKHEEPNTQYHKEEPAPTTVVVVDLKRTKTMGKAKSGADLKASIGGPITSSSAVVSIVGAPAALKPRWVDHLGQEAVAKLQLSKKEIQRQEVIYEVLTTERDYVEDLSIIIELYMKGLKDKKLLRPKEMSVIFSNVEQILPVNQMLLGWLEERHKAHQVVELIGDVFIRVSDYLKMYTMYCSNHPYALVKLESVRQNKSTAKFLDQAAMTPESRHLNLANFLLKPVQRICKYPLLLREIIKNTESTHPDYETLTNALLKIETVVTIVNEGARQAENVHRMLELQAKFAGKINIIIPSRVLIKQGTLDFLSPSSNERKKREFFLFNDTCLVAKAQGEDKLKPVALVPFDMILINSLPDQPHREHLIEIVHVGSAKFTMAAESAYSKQQWMKSFKEATDGWVDMKAKLLARVQLAEGGSKPVEKDMEGLTPLRNALEAISHSDEAETRNVAQQGDCIHPLKLLERKHSALVMSTSNPGSATSDKPPTPLTTEPPRKATLTDDKHPEIKAMLDRRATNKTPASSSTMTPHSRSQTTPVPTALPTAASLKPVTVFKLPSEAKSSPRDMVVLKPVPKKDTTKETLSQSNESMESDVSSMDGKFRIATNRFIVQDSSAPTAEPNPSANTARARSATVDVHRKPFTVKTLVPMDAIKSGENTSSQSSLVTEHVATSPPMPIKMAPPIPPKPDAAKTPEEPIKMATKNKPPVPPHKPMDMSLNRAGSAPSIEATQVVKPTVMVEAKAIPDIESQKPKNETSVKAPTSDEANVAAKPGFKRGLAPNVRRPVKTATVVDVVKQTGGKTKDYVYTVHVSYVGGSGGVDAIVQKTFDEYFDFHIQLLGHFPEEAGLKPGNNGLIQPRIIPELPGQIMFVSESLAKTRLTQLQDYTKQILSLPPKISRSPLVMNFFKENL